MRLKEKKLLQKFAATLKKFSAQGAKKVEYGTYIQVNGNIFKGNNCLFSFLATYSMESTVKGKDLLEEQILSFKSRPKVERPLKVDPTLEGLLHQGKQTGSQQSCPPW